MGQKPQQKNGKNGLKKVTNNKNRTKNDKQAGKKEEIKRQKK